LRPLDAPMAAAAFATGAAEQPFDFTSRAAALSIALSAWPRFGPLHSRNLPIAIIVFVPLASPIAALQASVAF
jgi:hypothetical protein